jgi:hypothetical protein
MIPERETIDLRDVSFFTSTLPSSVSTLSSLFEKKLRNLTVYRAIYRIIGFLEVDQRV